MNVGFNPSWQDVLSESLDECETGCLILEVSLEASVEMLDLSWIGRFLIELSFITNYYKLKESAIKC